MYITDVKACVDRLACETMNKRHTNVKLEEVKLAKTEQWFVQDLTFSKRHAASIVKQRHFWLQCIHHQTQAIFSKLLKSFLSKHTAFSVRYELKFYTTYKF